MEVWDREINSCWAPSPCQEPTYCCFLAPSCSDIRGHTLHGSHQTWCGSSPRSLGSRRGDEIEVEKVPQSQSSCTPCPRALKMEGRGGKN